MSRAQAYLKSKGDNIRVCIIICAMMRDRVLLTGASGSMGNAAFLELLKLKNKYDIVLLLRPSKRNKKYFTKYFGKNRIVNTHQNVIEQNGLKIVWGDLTNPDDVMSAVNGCDFVLHPAALISPAADHNPKRTEKVNIEGTKNLINAIKKQKTMVTTLNLFTSVL